MNREQTTLFFKRVNELIHTQEDCELIADQLLSRLYHDEALEIPDTEWATKMILQQIERHHKKKISQGNQVASVHHGEQEQPRRIKHVDVEKESIDSSVDDDNEEEEDDEWVHTEEESSIRSLEAREGEVRLEVPGLESIGVYLFRETNAPFRQRLVTPEFTYMY